MAENMIATALITAPDYGALLALVEDSVSSPHSKAAYRGALLNFFGWWRERGGTLDRAFVNAYRSAMEAGGKSPATVNQSLSAIKRFAAESAEMGYLDVAAETAISRIPGVRQLGVRAGNWLTGEQATALLEAPDRHSLKGVRDRAILGLLVGAGLRRDECARLTREHIQERDGRPCIVDLVGKGQRVRTVPIPPWVERRVSKWAEMAGIPGGRLFQRIDRHGNLGEYLCAGSIYGVVREYAAELGFAGLCAHDLRRTHAKLARRGGADLSQIQFALGHASVATTERYVGENQNLRHGPCDSLGLEIS